MKSIAKTVILALVVLFIVVAASATANAGIKPVQQVKSPNMTTTSGYAVTGGITGRVTTTHTTFGIADVDVWIVNASNFSQYYWKTRTNAQGYFQLTNVNNTWVDSRWITNNLYSENPSWYTSPGYYPLYKAYCNDTLWGDAYSNNFTVEMNSNAWAAIIINPKPNHITMSGYPESIVANGTGWTTVAAFVTDASGNPVNDNTPILFCVDQSNWAASKDGSLGNIFMNEGLQSKVAATVNGYASVSYGWIGSQYGGKTTRVNASFYNDPTVNATMNITVADQTDSLKIIADSGTALTQDVNVLISAQLFYNGLPSRRSGVAVTFSSDNDAVIALPSVRVNLTDVNGVTMHLLYPLQKVGFANITARATIDGVAFQDTIRYAVLPGSVKQVRQWPSSSSTGGIVGRVTAQNGTAVPNAYVTIVSASDTSRAYNFTQADSQGYFNITGVNATGDRYRAYAYDSYYGERYSTNFSVMADSNMWAPIMFIQTSSPLPPTPYPARIVQIVPAPPMQGPQEKGSIYGRATTFNTTVAIANSFVAVVNASNYSQAFFVGLTDAQGYFSFVNVNNTYDTAAGSYRPKYKIYVNSSTMGEGWSNNFSVEAGLNYPAAWTAVIVNPLPNHISLSCSKGVIAANGNDNATISAYVTDFMGNAVSDNTPVTFKMAPGTNYASFSGTSVINTITIGTISGYANTSFGWVDAAYAGYVSQINVSYSANPLVNSCISIPFAGSSIAWNKTYGGSESDLGRSVIAVSDGYVIAGSTGNYGSGHQQVYLVKTDLNGNQVWSHSYGSAGEDNGWTVIAVSDGYVIVGCEGTGTSMDSRNVLLIKTDLAGNQVWSRTYGGAKEEAGFSVVKLNDGYAIAGFTYSYGNGSDDFYLVRTDLNGNMIWQKTYGGKDDDCAFSLVAVSDGFVMVGRTWSFGHGSYDIYAVKADLNGNLVWNQTYGGSNVEYGFSIVSLSDGYAIGGSTGSFGNRSSTDMYLVRTDLNGNPLWQKTYGGTSHEYCYSVAAVNDGFVLAGYKDTLFPSYHVYEAILVKTDLGGNLAWSRTFAGDGNDYAYSVIAANGGYVVAGSTTANSHGSDDVSLIKVNEGPMGSNTFTINLHQGWNLVSIPLTPDNTSLTSVISAEALSNIWIIWYYDNSNPNAPAWKFYKPGRAVNTLASITSGMGFWVLATWDTSFTVTGTLPVSNPVLKKGWNMVGPTGLSTHTPYELYGSYYLTWGFKNNQWSYYKPSRTVNTLSEITPGQGYWVLVT